MKKIILTTIILIGSIVISNGQDVKPESLSVKEKSGQQKEKNAKIERQSNQLSEMDKVVTLSEDQRSKIAEINKVHNTKMKAVRMKYSKLQGEERKNMKSEMDEIQEERKKKVRTILTDEQEEKWKSHQKKKKQSVIAK